MNKKPALIAAFLTTIVVALAMLMIGVSAYINPDSVPISVSAANPSDTTNISLTNTAAADQIAQLQSLVAQYQSREQQYQTQLDQATGQIKQYQNIITQLQRTGLIAIDRNGQISITRRRD